MSHETEMRTIRGIARVMDRLYLDPLVGLFLPGVGDILTGATGLYTVVLALRMRVPKVTVARMLVNLAVDLVVGAIPVAGDAFDAWFKAHERNLKLLERRSVEPSSPRDGLYVAGAALLFIAALAVPIVLVVWALRQL
jgi:hypothetical protein